VSDSAQPLSPTQQQQAKLRNAMCGVRGGVRCMASWLALNTSRARPLAGALGVLCCYIRHQT
jgi:hypothetical protein